MASSNTFRSMCRDPRLRKRQTASAVIIRDSASIPFCLDFTREFEAEVALGGRGVRLGFLPGSTLGNFDPEESVELLDRMRRLLGAGGGLLVGMDRPQEKARLEAAYNDAAGVTAEFNRNVLHRLNVELGADFSLEHFHHYAFFNEQESRIEMHLISTREQVVSLLGERISFLPGESIHTESSYKYTPRAFERIALRAGFRVERVWSDGEERFGIYLLKVEWEEARKGEALRFVV